MSDLEELEAIKRVKYKYLRCIDTKSFDELAECFTEDAEAAYDKGRYSATGREAVLEFLVGALKREDVASMHNVHCPELEITSSATAKGTWYLHDYVVNPGADVGAGKAALALLYSMAITRSLNMLIRSAVDLELGMNAVERIHHYSAEIAQEAPHDDPPLQSEGRRLCPG